MMMMSYFTESTIVLVCADDGTTEEYSYPHGAVYNKSMTLAYYKGLHFEATKKKFPL